MHQASPIQRRRHAQRRPSHWNAAPHRHRKPKFDLDRIPGPWREAQPIVGNILACLRPDFHRVLLRWSDQYGGIYR